MLMQLKVQRVWLARKTCKMMTKLDVSQTTGEINMWKIVQKSICRLCLKCDGTHTETRLRLLVKCMSPFKLAGVSVQSNTGSRGVHISGSNAGYTVFRGSVRGTRSLRQFPLHFPSHVSPCAITFQLDSTNRQLHVWINVRNWI